MEILSKLQSLKIYLLQGKEGICTLFFAKINATNRDSILSSGGGGGGAEIGDNNAAEKTELAPCFGWSEARLQTTSSVWDILMV